MSVFKSLGRLFGQGETTEEKSITLTSPEAFELFGAVPVRSGVTVTADSAMRVPAVSAAIGLISESCGGLPFKLYDQATREAQKHHPAYRLIHDRANDWTSAEELRGQITADALLYGNGFAQVARNGEGRPIFLLRMTPSAVSIEYDDFGEPSYRVRLKGGGDRVLHYSDVLHISTLDGKSPIVHAKEAIGLAIAAEQHIANWFGRGARPSGYLSTEQDLTVDEARNILEAFQRLHTGAESGRPALFDKGVKYHPLSTSNTDAEFYNNRIEQIREIARAFRVPVTMLWELSYGTMANTEQLSLQFLQFTLRPWKKRWESAYTRVLLSPDEQEAMYIRGNEKDLMAVDFVGQATAYSQYRSMGAMTANDVRARMDMPPVEGGDILENPFTTSNSNRGNPNE